MKRLHYYADPMCSWCWGFTPVIDAILNEYGGRFDVELIMGGLRPGTTEAVTAAFRDEILHHWHEVNRVTGQPFAFNGAMPDGFVYDTEPPSRAVVTVGAIRPEAQFPYFKSIQSAFYTQRQDVTRRETLATLSWEQGVDAAEFIALFDSPGMKQETTARFRQTARVGVRGFPTVLLDPSGSIPLTTGYRRWEELKPRLEAWSSDAG